MHRELSTALSALSYEQMDRIAAIATTHTLTLLTEKAEGANIDPALFTNWVQPLIRAKLQIALDLQDQFLETGLHLNFIGENEIIGAAGVEVLRLGQSLIQSGYRLVLEVAQHHLPLEFSLVFYKGREYLKTEHVRFAEEKPPA